MTFKESETLELKKSTSELKEAIVSVSSILNKHKKGELYFGIKNDGTIVGQNVSEQTIRDISKVISDNIEPKIFPEITEEKLEGKSCILVKFEGCQHAEGLATGTTRSRINLTQVKSIKIVIPPKIYRKTFGVFSESLESLREKNNYEISILSAIRDALLPKLMSGEIRVNVD